MTRKDYTPRTDALIHSGSMFDNGRTGELITLARTLERELGDAAREVLAQSAEIARLREALTLCVDKLDAMRERFGNKWPLDLTPVRAETAARAALAKGEA